MSQARKKYIFICFQFKELQELKKKRNESNEHPHQTSNENVSSNSAKSSSRNTPIEQALLPNNDALNLEITNQELENATSNPALPSYFGVPDSQAPTAFFDSISPSNVPESVSNQGSPSLLTYFNTSEGNAGGDTTENIGLPRYFDNVNNSESIWENTVPAKQNTSQDDYRLFPGRNDALQASPVEACGNENEEDALSLDYPEITQNEISEYARKSLENLSIGSFPVAQYQENNLETIFSPTEISDQKLLDYLGKEIIILYLCVS